MAGRRLIVVMGVAGCGKSTIAEALAGHLSVRWFDGDDLHPAANVEKMKSGVPLTDEDRWPWLAKIGAALAEGEGDAVGACSALKRVYRRKIAEAATEPVRFLHLSGDKALISSRMNARKGHFMPPALLDSQFATLEPLSEEEPHLILDIRKSVDEIVAEAASWLNGG
ncbi:MAG: gluconokinase [Pseudomonadota bacterium]